MEETNGIRIGQHFVRFNPEILGWQVIDLRVQPRGLVINAGGKGHAIALAKRRERDAETDRLFAKLGKGA